MTVGVVKKKRIVIAFVIVLIVLGILSFLLPYVGGSHGGITTNR